MIYIKTNNKIEAIVANPIWLNDKPADSNEYDWNCQRYILTLAPSMRELSEASTLEDLEAQELEEAKTLKIAQLKTNRNFALNNLIYSININGEGCDFYLRTSDLAVIQARINSLLDNTATKSWGCVDGKRVGLNKVAFQSLFRHISVNDETVYTLYAEKIEEIQDCKSIEDLNLININF